MATEGTGAGSGTPPKKLAGDGELKKEMQVKPWPAAPLESLSICRNGPGGGGTETEWAMFGRWLEAAPSLRAFCSSQQARKRGGREGDSAPLLALAGLSRIRFLFSAASCALLL